MARPKKDAPIDLSVTHELSVGLIERLSCPAGLPKAFLRDKDVTGLRVRVTANGVKSFVFEAKLKGKAISRTLGGFNLMTIGEAKDRARELARTIKNDKQDPRELDRQQDAAKAAKVAAATAQAMTVGDVWPRYLEEGKPKRKDAFKPRYRADLEAMAASGGVKKVRGQGVTRPGPLFPLLALALSQVNEDTLKSWFDFEAKAGKHQAARALMMFRGFMRWCSSKPEYRSMIDRDAGRAAAIVEALPQVTKRTDCLEVAQLPGWFAGADKLGNRTIATYLKALLITGSRREEMAGLRWTDVDFRWNRLTLADKVDATRVIPLTPYLAQQLAALPRTTFSDGLPNPYVFASNAKGGRITEPRASHAKVMLDAGISTLTIHGLRRSFSLLGESAGAPAGAIAQVMGHKPSATAEGYRPRSVDALRPYLALIEAHILQQAGVVFEIQKVPSLLRIV